ncbi:(S)-8-oxocitronellyl enol synthase CYC2-like [Actinidia eriantha]|uniref:(S)-8-oxocitronellyl enol synthase CYC2-like n=1 Tax=Actinidia eriantha TaxID=165200 RepID=UPI00258C731B|nr:(S)-8-oxocitronellyl enol synthase CYC2-like [Actinidia eriantha]XP_057484600.1 (S)-8-oxocitronellyl enol synthase CYC2-like [Actinidia eriantha]
MAVGKCNGAEAATKNNIAAIFGVTGLVGKELLRKLLSKSRWKVYGIARKPEITPIQNSNYHFISCDLLNPSEAQRKLSLVQDHVTHVFWVTWASQFPIDTQQCYDQNKAMMSNALNALIPTTNSLKHFSLQTGMKHYVSLQCHSAGKEVCYYDEGSPRASGGYNFYYALEDLMRERLGEKVAWSVHRPGLIMGSSQRTLFNFMGCLGLYGSICKYLNLPFVFGGTRECWEEMHIDGSDARLVAEQHIWAATNEKIYSSDGQAFNAINGPSFTWKDIWPAIGLKFGVEVPNNMFSTEFVFSRELGDKGGVWREIVEEEGLVQTEMEDLANWEFLDMLFRCPVKMLGTREKADRLGYTTKCNTLDSVLYWIDNMREEKLIP